MYPTQFSKNETTPHYFDSKAWAFRRPKVPTLNMLSAEGFEGNCWSDWRGRYIYQSHPPSGTPLCTAVLSRSRAENCTGMGGPIERQTIYSSWSVTQLKIWKFCKQWLWSNMILGWNSDGNHGTYWWNVMKIDRVNSAKLWVLTCSHGNFLL